MNGSNEKTIAIQDLSDRDLRQRDLVPPERLCRCHALVIGTGAIGRQVSLTLAAMGVPALTLIDFDSVDVVNLAPQGFRPEDLGQLKVDVVGCECRNLNPDLDLTVVPDRFKRSHTTSLNCFAREKQLVLFCCVDSIDTRGRIWEQAKQICAFFADARMSAEVIRVLACGEPASDSYYDTTVFAPEEAFVGSCTAKTTLYSASIAANLMVSQFAKWLRGLPVDRDLLLNLLASEMTVS